MTLILFLLIISLSVFVHELGHYLAARLQGVRVPSFGIGLPLLGPPLFRYRRSPEGTEWRLHWLLLGGYAEIEGMATPPGEAPTGFARLRLPGQLLILVAGVLMNLLLAWLLLGAIFSTQGYPQPVFNQPQILQVLPHSLAQQIGLQPGDVILEVDGHPLKTYTDLSKLRSEPGEHTLTVLKAGRVHQVHFLWSPKEKEIGIVYSYRVRYQPLLFPLAFLKAIGFTLTILPSYLHEIGSGLIKLFLGEHNQLSGVVGIAVATGQAAHQGLEALLSLVAFINISLAVLNLMPIPGLDGGRILILLVESLLRRKLQPEYEAAVTYMGLAFIFLVFILVTAQDLRRLLGG